jgi:hypothetical protein
LHQAIEEVRADRPFSISAMVLLPDHLHAIWTLPEGDADYPTRWKCIKAKFTQLYLKGGGMEGIRHRSGAGNIDFHDFKALRGRDFPLAPFTLLPCQRGARLETNPAMVNGAGMAASVTRMSSWACGRLQVPQKPFNSCEFVTGVSPGGW